MVKLRLIAWALVGVLGCVAPPEAGRDGGTRCQRDEQCNNGATCGLVRPCILGYCAENPTFRACGDGGYPDGGMPVGQCLTYVDCNTQTCGSLVACQNNRCDPNAPRVEVSCTDGGAPTD